MSRRRRLITVCLLAVVLVVSVQWARSFATVRKVTVQVVETDCPGQNLDAMADHVTIETSRQMRCRFKVLVSNDGGRSVKLDAIKAPFLGADTGTVIRAASIEGRSPAGGRDAIINTTRVVPPHGAWQFTIVAVFNPAGCNDSGTITFYDWPQVTAYSFANRREVHADFDLSFHNTIRTPGCRALEGQQ